MKSCSPAWGSGHFPGSSSQTFSSSGTIPFPKHLQTLPSTISHKFSHRTVYPRTFTPGRFSPDNSSDISPPNLRLSQLSVTAYGLLIKAADLCRRPYTVLLFYMSSFLTPRLSSRQSMQEVWANAKLVTLT